MEGQVNITAKCSDYVLANFLGILQDVIGLLQIIIPIVLILGLAIEFARMIMNPDEKKYPKALKNRIFAAVAFFFIPMLLNIVLAWLPDTITLAGCWDYANQARKAIDNSSWQPVIEDDTWFSQLNDYMGKIEDNNIPTSVGSGIGSGSSSSGSSGSGAPYSNQYQIVEYAKQFVGNPYVWGGNSLTNGVDCSGFVELVYKNFGYTLPPTTATMRSAVQRGELRTVSESEIQMADIVLYDSHVAILTGNGPEIVHAANSRLGIIIGSSYNYSRPLYFIRVV